MLAILVTDIYRASKSLYSMSYIKVNLRRIHFGEDISTRVLNAISQILEFPHFKKNVTFWLLKIKFQGSTARKAGVRLNDRGL